MNRTEKTGLFGRIVRWLYSGRHPQQKYYKNLYETSVEQHKKFKREPEEDEKEE